MKDQAFDKKATICFVALALLACLGAFFNIALCAMVISGHSCL
jgi:hypothetical protein